MAKSWLVGAAMNLLRLPSFPLPTLAILIWNKCRMKLGWIRFKYVHENNKDVAQEGLLFSFLDFV